MSAIPALTLAEITARGIDPALKLLRGQRLMRESVRHAKIKAARTSASTLAGPDHQPICLGDRPMAAANSTKLVPAARSGNGSPLYERICRGCGKLSLVKKRDLECQCNLCALKARAIPSDARSKRGDRLFANPCPACGKKRYSDKRRLGTMCQKCARAATAERGGVTKHPLYWRLMGARGRCECPGASYYANYGGRGIKVCDEWRNDPWVFIRWAEVNGYAPELELDRIDGNGPYAPWNCRFVTHTENMRNARNTVCGEVRARAIKDALAAGQSVKAAARLAGVGYMVAWHIKNGHTWLDA